MRPKRIQRQRTKGWRMPDGAIYVGRPTRWGNEWRVGERIPGYPFAIWIDRQLAVALFRTAVTQTLGWLPDMLAPLYGHDLACWCPLDQPCHADVLLELANA